MAQTVRKRKVEIPRQRHVGTPKKAAKPEPVDLRSESLALVLVCLGVFLLVSLWSYVGSASLTSVELEPTPVANSPNIMGPVGAFVAGALITLLGWCSFITVLWSFLLARSVWCGENAKESASLWRTFLAICASLVMASAAAAFVTVLFGYHGGGMVGRGIVHRLSPLVGEAGTVLVASTVFLLSLGLATGVGTGGLVTLLNYLVKQVGLLLVDTGFFISRSFGVVLSSSGRILYHLLFSMTQLLKVVIFGPVLFVLRLGRKKPTSDSAQADDLTKDDAFFSFERPRPVGEAADEVEEIDDEDEEEARTPAVLRVSRRDATEKGAKGFKALRKVHAKKKLKRLALRTKEKKAKAKGTDNFSAINFTLPPLDLLVSGDTSAANAPDDKELMRNSERLEKTLLDFRIGGKIVEVQPGPVITLYEFAPAAGVKVQRIISLADDLALALKVGSVRVYAPVPGKGTVGIEVPNTYREVVRLRDVLASDEFQNAESPLTLAVGKDTFGDPFVADLSRMPHLLIAGATGTGKSVCINSMLLSLLYRNTPQDLRFIMIDPKMLELSLYEDIPHLKAPVVTNPKRARGVLWWAVEEMERRYRLMKDLGVRSLDSYNRTVSAGGGGVPSPKRARVIELEERDVVATGAVNQMLERSSPGGSEALPPRGEIKQAEPLPRIVIVVDELADLMLTVGREVEELFTRLAQKARAAGIHLILATQRPSVNVITGLIKANFPARVSFKVASRIDARTVLDTSGSEKLLGQGDMLFLSPASGRVKRMHSAFVSDKEVQDVVEMLKQQGPPDYDREIESMIEKLESSERSGDGLAGLEGEFDPLYDQAVALVVDKGQASTSMIQRVFRIGYNRAARILETMEREGVVGPADGAKPRSVFSVARALDE